MFNKFMTVVAWAFLAFIAFATLSPIQDRPTVPISSNFEHVGAFAVLGALFCLVYPRHVLLVCIIVFGGATLLEIFQLFTPDRHGRIMDVVGKIAGGALGIVAARIILSFEQASRWFQD